VTSAAGQPSSGERRTPSGIDEERGQNMPKMKTKKSAAKRFKIRAGGSIKRGQAFKRHILTKKSTKTKRHLRGPVTIHASDELSVRRMLPYA
jgi:large subunit ribosomal protein L35